MTGWIKIHRDIANHWIFQDAEKFKWWIDMLFLASFETNKTVVKNQIIEVKRGQFLGSISFFMSRWKISKERVITFLKMLQAEGMIDKKTDKNLTLITICNYESYQDVPDNLPDKKSDYYPDNLPDNLPDTTKEGKEIKEINIQANRAYTREENALVWDASKEQGFYQTFKGQGAAIPMATKTGRRASEILQLLDVYMAHRQLKNLGHSDYACFVNLFTWHIENNKISIPAQTQAKKKVISGADVLKVYG